MKSGKREIEADGAGVNMFEVHFESPPSSTRGFDQNLGKSLNGGIDTTNDKDVQRMEESSSSGPSSRKR